MEVRNSGDVPVVTGEGTCEKAGHVIGEIGDDSFNNLQGEPGGRGWACHRSPQISTPRDFGKGSVPSSFDK